MTTSCVRSPQFGAVCPHLCSHLQDLWGWPTTPGSSGNFLLTIPCLPSASPGPSSVPGSFKRRGRGTGAHPSLLCCLSLPLPLPSLLWVTFHPSLGCPSKAAPVVNNFGWQPHTKPWPETIVPGTMPEQPNNEAAAVLSDVLRCPGKGGGAVGLTLPAPPGAELFPLHVVVPLSKEAPGTCARFSVTSPCECQLGRCHPETPQDTRPTAAVACFSLPCPRLEHHSV